MSRWHDAFGMLQRLSPTLMRRYPGIWDLCYPRRYATPSGYMDPKVNAGLMMNHLALQFQPNPNKVEVDCVLAARKICESLVPTIFVGQEFAESLVMTQPPENLTIEELQWPFEGMVFVLPEAFQNSYFGAPLPFLRVANHPSGMQPPPANVKKVLPLSPVFGISECKFDERCFIVAGTSLDRASKDGWAPVDYSASFSDKESVGQMMSEDIYTDFTERWDSRFAGFDPKTEVGRDRTILTKMIALAAHLLLAMNAVPEQIEKPSVLFPAKVKVQSKTPADRWVWHPHFIGKEYHWQHERESHGGTHASPRLHPRRGHWRHQPYGPGRKEKKVIWIKPLLIGAKPKDSNDTKD